MASIREVAKKAGVSTGTVSRVLNGTAPVSQETRERIERVMGELNYIPNELARGMFRKKAWIIAMLVPSIKHPFFSSLAEYIERDLYEKGYKLMLCSTSGEIDREREYLQFLKSNIVDGIIMAVNDLDVEDYKDINKPLVMLDYYVDDNTPLIVSDHRQGGKFAAEEFIRNNCKYVLHICGKMGSSNVMSYESHLELDKRLAEAGIKSRAMQIEWNTFDLNEYEQLAKTTFENYPQIDGVMCADMPAVAFLKAGIALGRKIPEELRIVAYDGTYAASLNEMKLTTVVQPIEQISKKVVSVMTRKVDGETVEEISVRLPVTLAKGQTT